MTRSPLILALIAGLSACGDGQPFTFGQTSEPGDDDSPPADNGVPEQIGRNVESVQGAAGDGTVDILVTGLDGPEVAVAFARNPALDVPGYVAYSYQDDPLDRFFVAMLQNSTDGALLGAAVIDGGQFNEYYGGVYYERLQPYSPDTGQVSYAGSYVGLTNIGFDGDQLEPVAPGTPARILPRQPARIAGDIFFNVNFDEPTRIINGAITDRQIQDFDADDDPSNGIQLVDLADLALTQGVITDDGSFGGAVELPDRTVVGSYAGIFGGTNATSAAGGLFLDGDWWDEVENENEIGLFVLTQCGEAGDAAICDQVN